MIPYLQGLSKCRRRIPCGQAFVDIRYRLPGAEYRVSVLGLEEGRGTPHPSMAEDRIPRTFVGPFLGSTDTLPSQDRHEAAEQTGPIRIGVRLGRVEFYSPAQVP